MTLSSRRRDERGTVAVLFALLAMVLFGVGALAVDIGQAYAKRSLLQTDVDLAVMAAAAELTTGGACNQEVIDKATEFLKKNEVPGQPPVVDLGGSSTDNDGFIQCNNWKVTLWAPKSHVDFTLAQVLPGVPAGHDVSSEAAAQIKSPAANATLPFFAVDGCDSGHQSIRNDSSVSTTPPVPPLSPTSATFNHATFTISPSEAAAGTTSMIITLSGSQMKGVTSVGFTGAAGPPYHYEVPITAIPSNAATTVTVNVPSEVLAVEDVWFVRVLADGEWSPEQEAQRFTVGEEKLYCDASLEGNFGTIDLPRNDTNSFELEWNMILGIQPRLAVHPSPNGQCDGQPLSIQSTPGPVDGTNCVQTETGLKIAATNDGLIQGKGGKPGRLDKDSTSNCSRSGNSNRTPTAIKGKYINDDLLSCFIINSAQIDDLVSGSPLGTKALSADIFKSPRFFWIPVLDTDPTTGTKWWPIVGRRPGFISDESLSATNQNHGLISEFNGLVEEPSGIREVDVILFDEKALPDFAPATGGEIDYTGSGTKVIVLVE